MRFALLLAIVCACGSAPHCEIAVRRAHGPALLWRVQRAEGPIVWLYGTIHDAGTDQVPAAAWRALEGSKQFASELGDDEPDPAKLSELARLPFGQDLTRSCGSSCSRCSCSVAANGDLSVPAKARSNYEAATRCNHVAVGNKGPVLVGECYNSVGPSGPHMSTPTAASIAASVPFIEAQKHASRHRAELESSESCACYFCFRKFKPAKITAWIDANQTALCPHCGLDSVIGAASGQRLDDGFLRKMHQHFYAYRSK